MTALDYARLTAPVDNHGTLIEPRHVGFGPAAQGSHGRPPVFALCGHDGTEIRRTVRQALGLSGIVIGAGHQPDLLHPGVWAKRVVASAVPSRLAAHAHVVQVWVDHDHIRQTALAVPLVEDRSVRLSRVPLPKFAGAGIYARIPTWSSNDVSELRRAVGTNVPVGETFDAYLDGVVTCPSPTGWVDQHVAGIAAADHTFGVHTLMLRASQLPFGLFLADMIANARQFAECYNTALANYRSAQGVRGIRHPIPDLECSSEAVELPWWVLSAGRRARLRVRGDRLLADDAEVLSIDSQRLSAGKLSDEFVEWTARSVRPRALTLTMWLRLVLTDFFIHGIGGAKYDRISDDIMRAYYEAEPPPIGVVTATLQLELPSFGVTPVQLHDLRQHWRDMQYNPQRHVGAEADVDPMIIEREVLVVRGRALRDERPKDHDARQAVFDAIRRTNQAILDRGGPSRNALIQSLAELEEQLRSDAVAASREFFFGLFSSDQLDRLRHDLVSGLDSQG